MSETKSLEALMIQVHPQLVCPADDTVLWRFLDFSKLMSMIQSSCLHFTQLTKMEDAFEGVLTKPTAAARVTALASFMNPIEMESVKTADAAMRKSIYLSCWHINNHESAAMWKLYLTSHEGVAIRTTYSHLKKCLDPTPELIFPAVVQYLDYSTDEIDINNLFHQMVSKRKSFSHESEFRLIWWSLADANKKLMKDIVNNPDAGIDAVLNFPGRDVHVLLSDLLQQVYVSPIAGDWFRDVVARLLDKYGIGCPCIKSDLYSTPVW